MLKITPHPEPGSYRLQLEGKLAGDWVAEFQRAWLASGSDRKELTCTIDLAGVDYADRAGCQALAQACAEGAQLTGVRPFIEELLKEIVHAKSS